MSNVTIKTERTSAGLRDALFDTLDDLRSGKTSPRAAAAVAGLAGQIVNVTRLELHYTRFVGQKDPAAAPHEVPALKLGTMPK